MKILTLKADKDYAKIYHFLKVQGLSESLISHLRKVKGAMILGAAPVTMRDKISCGDRLKLTFSDLESSKIPTNDLPLQVLFENEDILVVDKPSGVATIPSKSHFTDSLAGSVMKYMQKREEPFVFRAIGRLDKETSGIVVVALNQWAAEKTKVEKTYFALCHGKFEEKEFVIDKPIFTENLDGINTRKRQISSAGKSAKTHVRVLRSFGDISLIEATLENGRTHQIRLHFASIDHPLCGDRLYGCEDDFPRTMLHCGKAKITLPEGKTLNIDAPFPKDFQPR